MNKNTVALLTSVAILASTHFARSGSATWNLNPANGGWDAAANWTPATVPDGPSDMATFYLSNTTSVFASGTKEVNGILFNPGASAFTITFNALAGFNISGTGVTNNSGILQKFAVTPRSVTSGDDNRLTFSHSAAAGSNTQYTALGASTAMTYGGTIEFLDSSSAGSGLFVVEGGKINDDNSPGVLYFRNSSTAGNATIINNGGRFGGVVSSDGGEPTAGDAFFTTNGGLVSSDKGGSTSVQRGGNATLVTNGGAAAGAGGGVTTVFLSAEHATLIANGGTNGGDGGVVALDGTSTAEHARVEVFGNGSFNLENFNASTTVGSIEGDGLVLIFANRNLIVGSNSLDTSFSGTINIGGGYTGGSVTKVGSGKWTLSGANTYPDGTTVSKGALIVNNTTGSGTGSGPVQVNSGILGGRGTISGAVTIGTGNGAGAFLKPGAGTTRVASLRIQSRLTFKSDGTYTYKLNTHKDRADEVLTNGATIESGAQFNFHAVGQRKLAAGQVFTAISNTSAGPIGGAFANLPDGSTFTSGVNTFQVSYEGGDGNDLTLTVVSHN